jgi:ElaB/YqjD/DUF883 family membrane-anchored ribosome-binding protein
MTNDVESNAPASGTTPATRPTAKLSETEYLQREATDAQAAMQATLEQMRASLKEAADVRAWARHYPWATLGVAAAAGFVAAKVVLPSRRRAAEEAEPALLEKILSDEKIAARVKELSEQEPGQHAGSGLLQSLGMTLLRTFGPAVQSAITAALAAKAAQPDAEELWQEAEAREAVDPTPEVPPAS